MLEKGVLELVKQPGLLQQVLWSEGDEGGSCDQPVEPERVRHPCQVPDGDSRIGLGVDQERRCNILDRLRGRIFPGTHSSGFHGRISG